MKKQWSIIQVDAVKALQAMPADSIDLLFTDPAYESINKHRKGGPTVRLKKWFPTFPNSRYVEFLDAAYKAMKPNSHIYLFCDDETSDILKGLMKQVGFKVWKRITCANDEIELETEPQRIVWDKVDMGTGWHWREQTEFILFGEKGKRKLNSNKLTNLRRYKKVYNGYPSEKPVPLCLDIVSNSTQPGELVCDPFCGSASIGEASVLLGRKYVGYDIQKEACDIAVRRLNEI